MVTIFCLPKAYEGHFGLIQRNALKSWTSLGPDCEVLVFGDEAGIREAAAEFHAGHRGGVERNEFGTPLLHDVFAQTAREARHDILCYINSDILLFPDFARTLSGIAKKFPEFLVVGRRWNFDIEEPIPFSADPAWQSGFRSFVRKEGELYNSFNIDYFAFPKHLFPKIPPFAVGRPAWDNWMIYEARRRRIPVVDATHAIFAAHQNHDYSHTKEGRDGGKKALWFGVEAERNRELASHQLYSITDATHFVTSSGMVLPNLRPSVLARQARVARELYPEWERRLRPVTNLVRWSRELDHRFRLFMLRRGIDLFPAKHKRASKT